MELIPAIDLLGGRVVRLPGGDYGRPTVYSEDPLETVRRWVGEGAQRLHVVDLDGARSGRPEQTPLVGRVIRLAHRAGVPCQVAGGLRSVAAVRAALEAGADRVVLGTALLDDPPLVGELVARHGSAIAAALDVRGDRAVGSGWLPTGVSLPFDAARERVRRSGVVTVVLTGIDRDGTLAGPDASLARTVREALPEMRLIASGGITTVKDVVRLAELGLDGAILGRALYEGRISLQDATVAVA